MIVNFENSSLDIGTQNRRTFAMTIIIWKCELRHVREKMMKLPDPFAEWNDFEPYQKSNESCIEIMQFHTENKPPSRLKRTIESHI